MPESDPERPRTLVGLYARDKVVDLLRRTANELEREPEDSLLTAVALVSAGHPEAFKGDGALVCIHAYHQTEPIPDDLIKGLEQALHDARNFTDTLKDGADS